MKQILTNLKVYLTLLLLCGVSSVWAETATFVFNTEEGLKALEITAPASSQGTDLGSDPYVVGGASMTVTNGSTNTRVWNSSGSYDLRMYKNGGSLTLSVASGYEISSVAFTGTCLFSFSSGTYKNSTWSGLAESITFTATGTNKITTITVTYSSKSSNPAILASDIAIESDATSGEIAYTIANSVDGKSLTASTDAECKWIFNVDVTSEKVTFETTKNTGDARTATIVLKYEGAADKNITVTQAKAIPTYTSLAELVGAGEPTTAGETVKVTLSNEVITDFYVTGSGYRNGIYLNVDGKEIEVYCQNVPSTWEVGGKVSGTITCPWKDYNGTWELCPTSWSGLEYTAPEKPKYDVLYSVLGVDAGSEEVAEGGFIKSAPIVKNMAGWKFAGWTAVDNYEQSTTAPTFFTATTPVVEDVILYAVFKKIENVSGEAWNLVTDASTLQANDVIRLAATVSGASSDDKNGTFAASAFGEGKFFTSTSAEINDDQLTAASAIDITLGGNASGWTLTTSEGFVGTTTAKSMLLNDNSTGVINEWTISINSETGAATITAGDMGRILYNRDSPRFVNYTSSASASMVLPFIFRKEAAGTTTYSTDIPLYYEFEMPAAGYATLYLDFPVAIPYGFDVYRAETYSSSTKEVKLSKMDADGNLPANFGVLVKGKPGDPACFKGFYVPNGMTGIHNLFTGVVEDTPVADVAENTIYVLNAAGSTTDLVKFSEYTGTTLNANKAYLDLDIPAGSNLTFVFDDATAIENVNAAKASAIRVNLAGQVVGKDYKGIVIENGKKFLNK